jgi:hypothetical protein
MLDCGCCCTTSSACVHHLLPYQGTFTKLPETGPAAYAGAPLTCLAMQALYTVLLSVQDHSDCL